mmetsp:Transcript_9028/g.23742  ORF Transcript_9028/g.23742 Transcript_9028/m.23742 type:complete len:236 (-) Transcript_9028:53-760(-)
MSCVRSSRNSPPPPSESTTSSTTASRGSRRDREATWPDEILATPRWMSCSFGAQMEKLCSARVPDVLQTSRKPECGCHLSRKRPVARRSQAPSVRGGRLGLLLSAPSHVRSPGSSAGRSASGTLSQLKSSRLNTDLKSATPMRPSPSLSRRLKTASTCLTKCCEALSSLSQQSPLASSPFVMVPLPSTSMMRKASAGQRRIDASAQRMREMKACVASFSNSSTFENVWAMGSRAT